MKVLLRKLRDETREAVVAVDGQEFSVRAGEIEEAIRALAFIRSRMAPDAEGDRPPTTAEHEISNPSIAIEPAFEPGGVTLKFVHPGIGWMQLELDAGRMPPFIAALERASGPDPTPTTLH